MDRDGFGEFYGFHFSPHISCVRSVLSLFSGWGFIVNMVALWWVWFIFRISVHQSKKNAYICILHLCVPTMSKRWLISLLLLPTLQLGAQSIRLTRYDAPNALYLNADRLYNFNMYERSRLELGVLWVSPSQTAAQQRKAFGQWTLSPYVAYGTGDHAWKYGMGAYLRLPGEHSVRLGMWAYNDLERAASRQLGEYRMLTPSLNNGIVTSRYSGVKGGGLDVFFTPLRGLKMQIGGRRTFEDLRFDSRGVYYPAREGGIKKEWTAFTELYARLDWKKSATLYLRAGRSTGEITRLYYQVLAQYDSDLGQSGLHLYGQTGFASIEAPYSRMFDLSGTAYSTYFFKNTFLTVRPNTFTANIFAHICLNYTAPLPLWECSWSSPRPFLQLNAMWGHLLEQNDIGSIMRDGLLLQAPYKGLLEPATGFDRLVHWGLLDVGFGVAYQICPESASYRLPDMTDNMAITIVADFILDRYK